MATDGTVRSLLRDRSVLVSGTIAGACIDAGGLFQCHSGGSRPQDNKGSRDWTEKEPQDEPHPPAAAFRFGKSRGDDRKYEPPAAVVIDRVGCLHDRSVAKPQCV